MKCDMERKRYIWVHKCRVEIYKHLAFCFKNFSFGFRNLLVVLYAYAHYGMYICTLLIWIFVRCIDVCMYTMNGRNKWSYKRLHENIQIFISGSSGVSTIQDRSNQVLNCTNTHTNSCMWMHACIMYVQYVYMNEWMYVCIYGMSSWLSRHGFYES